MSNITSNNLANNPLSLILEKSVFEQSYMRDSFAKVLRSLWQYEIFKPMLDLSATLCEQGLLVYKISDRRFFELDAGNCKTIEGGDINKLLNKMRRNLRFDISIKSMEAHVIVHETAHMIEKVLNLDLLGQFMQTILYEMQQQHPAGLRSAIDSIMVKGVQNYPQNQLPSELFARIYELFALTKEVRGHTSSYIINLPQLEKAFPQTIAWLYKNVDSKLGSIIDPSIAKASASYVKKIDDIKHNWSDSRIDSFHKKSAQDSNIHSSDSTNNRLNRKSENNDKSNTKPKTKPQWSKTIKSNKDDPFA